MVDEQSLYCLFLFSGIKPIFVTEIEPARLSKSSRSIDFSPMGGQAKF